MHIVDLEERRNRYIGYDLYNASRPKIKTKKKDVRLFTTRVRCGIGTGSEIG